MAGWTDLLLGRAKEAQRVEPVAPTPLPRVVQPRAKPEIKTVWVQTARPRNGDAGAAEPGWYSVFDGVVTMHDAGGKPTGKTGHLTPGEDPHKVAHRLAREAVMKMRGESDFNRPLHYDRSGYA